MEFNEKMYKLKELGLKIVDYAHANKWAEMGEMNELSEEKTEITEQWNEIKKQLEKEFEEE